jgi:hypothetical protein
LLLQPNKGKRSGFARLTTTTKRQSIVGYPEKKPAEQPSDSTAKTEVVPLQGVQATVIPPPPNVVKLSTQSISIPQTRYPRIRSTNRNPLSRAARRSEAFSACVVIRLPVELSSTRVDIKARHGDPIGASQRGVVEFAGWYYGYGYLMIVDHGGGVRTHYAHLSSFEVGVGTRVERGQYSVAPAAPDAQPHRIFTMKFAWTASHWTRSGPWPSTRRRNTSRERNLQRTQPALMVSAVRRVKARELESHNRQGHTAGFALRVRLSSFVTLSVYHLWQLLKVERPGLNLQVCGGQVKFER